MGAEERARDRLVPTHPPPPRRRGARVYEGAAVVATAGTARRDKGCGGTAASTAKDTFLVRVEEPAMLILEAAAAWRIPEDNAKADMVLDGSASCDSDNTPTTELCSDRVGSRT